MVQLYRYSALVLVMSQIVTATLSEKWLHQIYFQNLLWLIWALPSFLFCFIGRVGLEECEATDDCLTGYECSTSEFPGKCSKIFWVWIWFWFRIISQCMSGIVWHTMIPYYTLSSISSQIFKNKFCLLKIWCLCICAHT